eukprot:6479101-Amphidinium_carterae.1
MNDDTILVHAMCFVCVRYNGYAVLHNAVWLKQHCANAAVVMIAMRGASVMASMVAELARALVNRASQLWKKLFCCTAGQSGHVASAWAKSVLT